MDKQYSAHFPTAKIKKIIQGNQDIGKLSSTIPHLLECSLQIFLSDFLSVVNEIAVEDDFNKITPFLAKKALEKSGRYPFLEAFGREIDDEEPKRKKNWNEQGDKEAKPRKKRKTAAEKEDKIDEQ